MLGAQRKPSHQQSTAGFAQSHHQPASVREQVNQWQRATGTSAPKHVNAWRLRSAGGNGRTFGWPSHSIGGLCFLAMFPVRPSFWILHRPNRQQSGRTITLSCLTMVFHLKRCEDQVGRPVGTPRRRLVLVGPRARRRPGGCPGRADETSQPIQAPHDSTRIVRYEMIRVSLGVA